MSSKKMINEFREMRKDELAQALDNYKKELQSLRVAKVSGGAHSKVMKIGQLKKTIARVKTVINQNYSTNLKKFYKSKDYKPLKYRAKLTRAMRRALTQKQQNALTLKAWKKTIHNPNRQFVIVPK